MDYNTFNPLTRHRLQPSKHKHGEATPSVSTDVRRNKVHCFACGFDYSTIDLVMDVKQLDAIGNSQHNVVNRLEAKRLIA